MVADDDSAVGVVKGRRTRQQVKSRGSQRILIRSAIERLAAELLGGHIADGSYRDVVIGEIGDVVDPAGDAEVGQEHSSPTPIGSGHKYVLGLDVTMEQTVLMGEVERIGHRCHDFGDILFGHSARVGLFDQPACVDAIHVVHRDPQPALVLTTIENADDMWVSERRGRFGLSNEPRAELRVRRRGGGQDLERVVTRQPRMLGEVDLTHPSGAE